MAFSDYSATPASNTTIAGLAIGEGVTSPATVNNSIRQLMADGRSLFDTVNAINLSSYAGLNAPAFTGQPTYAGRGGFLYHSNPANSAGRVYVQSAAAALPTLSNGDVVMTFA